MQDDVCTPENYRLVVDLRRDFHKYPELSGEEGRSSAVIADFLRSIEAEVQTFSNHTGVCGIIRGEHHGPVIALRADMDALPVTEENDVPYKSANPGVMHACGHDAHMAMLLTTAKMLSRKRGELTGSVKVIFQPAEELSPVGGAGQLIQDGVLDDVEAIFGLHIWPNLPTGQIGIRPGALMAASDRFTVKVLGQGAHAGQPHLGVDAIAMAADIVQGMGRIVSRQLNPLDAATIAVGSIRGGERYNVVAREVVMEGTVRTLGENTRKEIPEKMQRMLTGVTAAQGGNFELNYQFGYPVLNNAEQPVNLVIKAAEGIIGSDSVCTDVKPMLTAEDFSRYLEKVPGAFFWLGCAKIGEKTYPLHNSRFDVDEEAMLLGCKILYQTALDALDTYGAKAK